MTNNSLPKMEGRQGEPESGLLKTTEELADLSAYSENKGELSFGHGTQDLEQAILGACLVEPFVVSDLRSIINREVFYPGTHRFIWDAIVHLDDHADLDVDLVSVTERLRETDKLDRVGGAYYLTGLTQEVASASNATRHAYILRERYIKRLVYALGKHIQNRLEWDEDLDALELVDDMQRLLHDVTSGLSSGTPKSLDELTRPALEHLDRIRGMEITGVPTGFHRFDKLTGGLQDGEFIIIAARPSMGKSTLLYNIAWNAATHDVYPSPGLIATLEMPNEQYVRRIAGSIANIDGHKARTGQLSDADMQRLWDVEEKVRAAPIWLVDEPSMNVSTLYSHARRLHHEEGLSWIGIDYLQLMQASGSSAGNREQEIAYISRSLKGLAKELSIPVIALAQLNRAVEKRGGDKRPQLSDLRESGQLEQDTDVVAFIYRAERYGIMQDKQGRSTENMAEILVEKQRNGPIGRVHLGFIENIPTFKNLSEMDRRRDTATIPQNNTGSEETVKWPADESGDGAPF